MDVSESKNENISINDPQANEEKVVETFKGTNAEERTEKDSKAEEVAPAEQQVDDPRTATGEVELVEGTNREDNNSAKGDVLNASKEDDFANKLIENGDGKISKDDDNTGEINHDVNEENSVIAEAEKDAERNKEQNKAIPEDSAPEGVEHDHLSLKKVDDLSANENDAVVKRDNEGLKNDEVVKTDNVIKNEQDTGNDVMELREHGESSKNEEEGEEATSIKPTPDARQEDEIANMANNDDSGKEEIREEATVLEVIEEGMEKTGVEKHDEDSEDVADGKRATNLDGNEGNLPPLTKNPVAENEESKQDSTASEALDPSGRTKKEDSSRKSSKDVTTSQGTEKEIDYHLKESEEQGQKVLSPVEGQKPEEQGQKLDTDQQGTEGEQQERRRLAENKVDENVDRESIVRTRSRSVERDRRSSTSSSGRSHRRSSRSGRRGSSLDRSDDALSNRRGKQRDEENVHFQDYLTRQVKEGRESELYLRQKLEQKDHELETAERKVNDLQLRLKRFVKDDKAKDERILLMERELRDLNDKFSSLSEMVDQNANSASSINQASNGAIHTHRNSKSCVIL